MPKASAKRSSPARPKRSSRPIVHPAPVARLHQTRKRLEAERIRLGMSEADYLAHLCRKYGG